MFVLVLVLAFEQHKMVRKNVKIPKASVTKLAKAYAQVLQRKREEEAILALGPSLEALSKKKSTKRKRRAPPSSPVYRTWRPRQAYEKASGFQGPLMPVSNVRNAPGGGKRKSRDEDMEEDNWSA